MSYDWIKTILVSNQFYFGTLCLYKINSRTNYSEMKKPKKNKEYQKVLKLFQLENTSTYNVNCVIMIETNG